MRFLIVVMTFLLLPYSAMAQDRAFRNMIWGVSKGDVRKFESALLDKEEGDALFFFEKPDEFRRLITYEFQNGKFWRGREEYRELHKPNPQTIIDMYGKTELEFEKKLGKPTREEFVWKNGDYKFFPQFWGRALRSGDLKIRAIWEAGDTRTVLEAYNDGMFYQITVTAEQKSVADAQQQGPSLLMPGAQTKAP